MAEHETTKKIVQVVKEADKIVQGVKKIASTVKQIREGWRGFGNKEQ